MYSPIKGIGGDAMELRGKHNTCSQEVSQPLLLPLL